MEIARRREKKGTADERDRFHVHIDPPSPRVKLGQHGVGRLRGGGWGCGVVWGGGVIDRPVADWHSYASISTCLNVGRTGPRCPNYLCPPP